VFAIPGPTQETLPCPDKLGLGLENAGNIALWFAWVVGVTVLAKLLFPWGWLSMMGSMHARHLNQRLQAEGGHSTVFTDVFKRGNAWMIFKRYPEIEQN
jgi:hypothetical protein